MSDKRYVFLSYGRKDVYEPGVTNAVEQEQHFPIVEKVYYHLDRLQSITGLVPWFDKCCLIPGDKFMPTIYRAIEEADYMLLFVGKNSMISEWCEREWKHALAHCVPIIPILLEGKWEDADVKEAYPSQIRSINDINPQNKDNNKKFNINYLLDKIVTAVSHKPPPLTIPVPARKLPEHYIERPQYLDDLKKRLGVNDINYTQRKNLVGITSHQETAALQGIGGIGKTTLALALCNDCEVRRAFDHIFWLEVGPQTTADDVPNLMRLIGTHFGDSPDLYTDLQISRVRVQRHLSGKRSLLVLDDVWAEKLIEQFSWAGIDCRLVVTTRNKGLVDNPQAISKLNSDEGLRLLATLLDPLNPDMNKLTDDHKSIVNTLEGYALAIAIAGKWLNTFKQKSANDYLTRLHSGETALLKNLDLAMGEGDKNTNLELSLSLSYNDLKSEDQKRFRALGLFATGSNYSQAALDAVWETDDGFIEAQRLVNVGLLDTVKGTNRDYRFTQHPLLKAYAYALMLREGEEENVFSYYASYYIKLAEEFNKRPPEEWISLEDDISNIQHLGDELIKRTGIGKDGDHEKALDFANNTLNYLFGRRQMKRIQWLEMGLNATKAFQATAIDKTEYQKREALFLNEIGLVWSDRGEPQKALEYFEKALVIDRELKNNDAEAITLTNMGDTWFNRQEPKKALEYFQTALDLSNRIDSPKREASILSNIGASYAALNEYEQALQYYQRALRLHSITHDFKAEAATVANIGQIYSATNKISEALEFYKQALRLELKVGDIKGEAITRSNIGQIHLDLGESRIALDYFKQSLQLIRILEDHHEEAALVSTIAFIHLDLNEKIKALSYFEQIPPLYKNITDYNNEAAGYIHIGLINFQLNEKDKAIEAFEKALSIYISIGDARGRATVLDNLAVVYSSLGNKQKALDHYKNALTLHHTLSNLSGEANNLYYLGQTYLDIGESQSARRHVVSALDLYRTIGDEKGKNACILLLEIIRRKFGN